jgi:hypothetical protein
VVARIAIFRLLGNGVTERVPMKTINVDHLPDPVVRAMEAVVETLREQYHDAQKDAVDPAKVKAAILARRGVSREVNRDWENVDRETWPSTSDKHN